MKVKRMHIASRLPSGKYKVHDIPGVEFSEKEFLTLQKLIKNETRGIHLWVI